MKNTDYYSDQTLANALPLGVIVLYQDGTIQWYNKKAQIILHLKPDHHHIAFSTVIEFPDFTQMLHDANKAAIEINNPVQKNMRLAITVSPYINTHFIVCIQDITHTYLLEKIRQDFIANVSHELRTPLTVIHGYLEMCVEQHITVPGLDAKPLKQMYAQSIQMKKLVSDLLLLSRLEVEIPENKANQRIDVLSIINTLCEDARSLSGERHHQIHWTAHTDKTLYGQPDEIKSAFANIIFNAVNYTPPGGIIDISWQLINNKLCLIVQDTGIGIEAQHIPRLTERFYRIDKARSRQQGGTGLGLAIVKHALLRHNGYLEISSIVDVGSTFKCFFEICKKQA